VLDNLERFVLEDFQEEVSADIFAGFAEVWEIVPEGCGKTTFMGAHALYHADYMPSGFVPIGASSREQAEILYRQAVGFVLRSPGFRDRFKCQEGYRRIKGLRMGSRIQVYAADDRTADGIIPTLALLDELHRHRNLRLYRTWRGKLLKRGGQIVTISTAGEPGSEFEDTRANIRRTAADVRVDGCHTRAVGDDIVLHDWAVPKASQADDMEIVAQANPLSGLTPEVLRKKFESPTMTREHWLRFVCNRATSLDGNGIQPEDWDACYDPDLEERLSPELEGFGWLDIAFSLDTTAVGVILRDEERDKWLVPAPVVLEPPVDERDIVRAIVEFERRFPRLRAWVMDRSRGGEQMAQMLEAGDHPAQDGHPSIEFVAHSQDNAPMSQAAVRFDEAIRLRVFRHDGDRRFRVHALNAVRKTTGPEKYKFDRPSDAQGEKRKRYPIDALTGVLMGHNVAVDELGTSAEPLAAWA
jgi:phage terminase large subunit-like protein